MQASTTVGDSIQKKLHLKKLHLSWQTLLLCLLALTFLAIGLWMRLRDLGLPAPRDDGEGVYWQSLRAMSACLRVIISPLCGALLTWLSRPLRSGLDSHVDNAPQTVKINVR